MDGAQRTLSVGPKKLSAESRKMCGCAKTSSFTWTLAIQEHLSECMNSQFETTQLNFITEFVLLLVNLPQKWEFEKNGFKLYCPGRRHLRANRAHNIQLIHQATHLL